MPSNLDRDDPVILYCKMLDWHISRYRREKKLWNDFMFIVWQKMDIKIIDEKLSTLPGKFMDEATKWSSPTVGPVLKTLNHRLWY